MKKLLVFMLTVVMLLSFGIIASATEAESTIVTTEAELANALKNGGNITLGADILVNTEIDVPAGITATLDLGGYAITSGYQTDSTTKHIYPINNYGTLTIKDSEGTGSITGRGIYVQDGSKLTLESGSIYGIDSNGGSAIYQYGGEVIINGGLVEQTADFTYNYAIFAGGGTIDVYGGKIVGKHGAISVSGADVTLYGGELVCIGNEGWTDNVVYVSAGSFTAKGGSVTHEGATANADSGAAVHAANSDVTIKIEDGTFVGLNGSISGNANTTISGGEFDTAWGTDEWDKVTNYVTTGAVVTIAGETTVKNEDGTTTTIVATVNGTGYATFDEAITAANALTGDVVVEIYGKVEYTDTTANLTGAYDKITFIGMTEDAEISLVRANGLYISGTSTQNVAFKDLILSRPDGTHATDTAHMGYFFTVYRVATLTYTNCQFPDGACAQNCTATYDSCTFYNNIYDGKYSLWVYAGLDCTVTNCTFASDRGIKMYAEGAAKNTNLTVTNTSFANCTAKPAIVLGYGKSVTLSGNTYSSKGVFELDAGCDPNGTKVTADITDIACMNDDYADCGVIVDGTIYVTLTDAVNANAITEQSTVTLMYSTTEAVELPAGTTLVTNGYTAENVTVAETKPQGTLNIAYISGSYINGIPAIFGEAVGVIGTESFIVELYCGETLVGTAKLVDNDKVLLNGSSTSITWHAALSADGDDWWQTEWVDDSLKVNAIPDNAKLYVDGEMVSTCAVQMNISDLQKPIVAAKVDANGVIEGFVVSQGFLNGVGTNKVDYAAALQEAFTQGGSFVLVRDITLTTKIDVSKNVTLDLNGKTITTSGISGSRVIVLGDGCTEFVINANGGSIVSGDALALGIIDVNTSAVLTVNGGTYDFDTNNGGLFKFRSFDSTITLNNVTVYTNGQVSGPNYAENVLDVNGGTFKAENVYNERNVFAFYVYKAKATFTDMTMENMYIGGIEVCGATVTVENCNISVVGTNSASYLSVAIGVSGGGEATINGGNYSSKPASASDASGQGTTHGSWTLCVMSSGGTLIVNGGTFSNGYYDDGTGAVPSNPRALISIGADADYGDNIFANLEIKAGTFTSIGALVNCETIWGSETDSSNTYMPTMDIAITDGDFTKVNGKIIGGCDPISTGNPVDVTISGGTYSENNAIDASYLAEGYEKVADGNGTYSVVVWNVELSDIFTYLGVSSKMNGTAITVGFTFDNEAYSLYCEQNNTTLDFGTHFAVSGYNADETSLVEYAEDAGQFNVIVNNVTDAHASYMLEMALYVGSGDNKQYVTVNGIESTISVTYKAIPSEYSSN